MCSSPESHVVHSQGQWLWYSEGEGGGPNLLPSVPWILILPLFFLASCLDTFFDFKILRQYCWAVSPIFPNTRPFRTSASLPPPILLESHCAGFPYNDVKVSSTKHAGDSHMKEAGMLVWNFELNPKRRPIWAWPNLSFFTPKRDHVKLWLHKSSK